jgi:imidazolonepropionase-like amidohydrolase
VTDPSAHPGVAGGAATAVDEQVSFGATVIKVAMNTQAGPVPDAATLAAIIEAARAHGLPVVAHAQGAGTAQIAIDAGIGTLAHTPFTEVLADSLLARAVAGGQRWISTLDIHRDDERSRQTAAANLTAFVRAGGAVLYGTDLGNGELPVGINARELSALHGAGLRGEALLATLTDPWPRADRSHGVCTFVPGEPPTDLDAVPAWLSGATVVPTEELIHDDHG